MARRLRRRHDRPAIRLPAKSPYQYDSKIERLAIKKISGGGTLPGPFHWAGVADQYFAAVFLPQDPQNAALVTLRNPIEIPHGGSDSKQMDKIDVLGAAVGSLKGPTVARLYVGPKALADLEAVPVPGITGADPDLRAVVDFGWLGIIARPLFLWLKWMYSHIVPTGAGPSSCRRWSSTWPCCRCASRR